MLRTVPAALSILAVAFLAAIGSGQPVTAGGAGCTITVNSAADNDDDDDVVTLRDAIEFATGLRAPGAGEVDEVECPGGGPGSDFADTIVFDTEVFPLETPTTITLTALLDPLFTGGDTIDGSDAGVIIDGNGLMGACVFVTSSSNTIAGLHVRNCESGVRVAGVFVVLGGSAGPQGVPQANNNLVVGNTLEGNDIGVLVEFSFASGNVVSGNVIGTGGDEALEPNGDGVVIEGASETVIGPEPLLPFGPAGVPAPNGGNVISGNTGHGISVDQADGTVIQGNYIGTDAAGETAVPNGSGIDVFQSEFVTIGGTGADEGNLISGNDNWGVRLIGSETVNSAVIGNHIGTDVTGLAALGNGGMGVLLVNAQSNDIGGEEEGAGNVISGNGLDGVALAGGAMNNRVGGNMIGVGADGVTPLGNNVSGVAVHAAPGPNVVGGDGGAQNTIAHNGADGITVRTTGLASVDAVPQGAPPPRLNIRANSIHSNGGLGIDLNDDGVDLNDPQDIDGGPNFGQNYPILTSAETNGTTHIEGTLNSTPNEGFTIRFYASDECDPSDYGEGQTYLGSKVVNTDFDGNAAFDADVDAAGGGQEITATAADIDGNTSEFSECIAVEGGATPTPAPTPTPSPTPTPTPTPTATPSATPTPGILGDTDCDLDVDAVDALQVLLEVAGLPTDAGCLDQGDVQCDGDRDAVDSLGILIHVAGLPPQEQEPGCPAIGDPIV